MSQRYVWRVYCPLQGQYVTTISDVEPTTCPNDATPVDPNLTTIMQTKFIDIISDGYVNVESQLSDNQALKLQASDVNGGIDINAGMGGITIDTPNAISIDSGASSNFTTSNGDLTISASAGLINIDAGSGMNIGNSPSTTPILIGTSANSKSITIGNNSNGTALSLLSGTGKMSFNSADISPDSISMFSSGGIDVDSSGDINLSSGSNTPNAITLDSSFNNGGIIISSGTQGIYLSSNNGPLALGSFSGGDVYLGTAAVARTIAIGNDTNTTSVTINSGTGGITIGNNTNGGEVQIANVPYAKTIIIGNSTGSSRLINRFGTGGLIKHQESHVQLSDSDAVLTITDLLKSIFTITPTIDRTLTLPTAANAVSGISGVEVGDSIDFTIINNSAIIDEADVILNMGLGGTIEGNNNIPPKQNNTGTFFSSGSSLFRLRFTNITGGSETYTVYRIS